MSNSDKLESMFFIFEHSAAPKIVLTTSTKKTSLVKFLKFFCVISHKAKLSFLLTFNTLKFRNSYRNFGHYKVAFIIAEFSKI